MILAFLFSLILFSAEADNLGVFGEVFEIEEDDLLEHIFKRFTDMKEREELNKVTLESEERIRKMIQRPAPVRGISNTKKRRKYTFDPTITVTKDIMNHEGKIFAHKGDKFNPLDQILTMKPLLFIDGDNKEQIEWVKAKLKDEKIQNHELGKVILIKGSPLSLQEKLRREVFFDQYGILTKKLGIKHVPAIVFQERQEKVLTIVEEVV